MGMSPTARAYDDHELYGQYPRAINVGLCTKRDVTPLTKYLYVRTFYAYMLNESISSAMPYNRC